MDKNVTAVQKKMAQRAAKGLSKYGVTTERKDLSDVEWLQHLQDELMDGAVYVQRIISDLEESARYIQKLIRIDRAKLKPTPRGGRDKERPVKQKVTRGGRDKERPVLQ